MGREQVEDPSMGSMMMRHALHEVLFTSPVSPTAASKGLVVTLPMSLLLHIVSLLDDISDLARITRTSRLLHYIAQPFLYRRVSLRSHGCLQLQMVESRRSGYGGPSPFNMALQGLVTRPYASLVRHLHLSGEIDEPRQEDFQRGRVPDKTMLLSVLIGVALEKMTNLESFTWELDYKPQKIVYQAMALHKSLTKLSLCFPSNRQYRNTCTIPPLPNLRALTVQNLDPSCSPDDISLLLLQSHKLEDLRLHFSPRLRREADVLANLESCFRRCLQAGHKLDLRHFAMQNVIAQDPTIFNQVFAHGQLPSECYFDTFGGFDGDPRTAFADNIWRLSAPDCLVPARHIRVNEFAPEFVRIARSKPQTIQNLILVSERGFGPNASVASSECGDSGSSTTSSSSSSDIVGLAEAYVETITEFHGRSIRRLLLPDRFALSLSQIKRIVQFCPDLEQLGCALDFSDRKILHLLLPSLKHLCAVRILSSNHLLDGCDADERDADEQQRRMYEMACDPRIIESPQLAFVGFASTIYRIGQVTKNVLPSGKVEMRRKIAVAQADDVQHIDIWGLDNLDISIGGLSNKCF
jgi:hypothetical protein